MMDTTRSKFSGFENTLRAEIFHIEFAEGNISYSVREQTLLEAIFWFACIRKFGQFHPLFSLLENKFSNSLFFRLLCLVDQYPRPN